MKRSVKAATMKKSVDQSKVIALHLILLAAMLLLSSCTSSQRYSSDVNYFTGVAGVTLDFDTNAPPEQVYEDSDVPITLVMKNQGPIDVGSDTYAQVSVSYDPFYFSTGASNQHVAAFKQTQVHGKSYIYPAGDLSYVDYALLHVNPVPGTRQLPATQIFASLCYPYKTILDTEVCMDGASAYPSARSVQACTAQPISFLGQGSPVAITEVNSQMIPVGDGKFKPLFTITIENKGDGSLLAPADAQSAGTACDDQDSKRKDWNTMAVSGSVVGAGLQCTPSVVRLVEGKGTTRCSFLQNQEPLISQSNYLTQLHVELNYVYSSSASRKIEITRNPVPLPDAPADLAQECASIAQVKNETGACISKCEYCSTHNANDPRWSNICSLTISNTRYVNNFDFYQNLSCACSRQDCLDKEPKGTCVFEFCSGASYCCAS